MKILYGIQGTGNGHITRARHLAKIFNERDDIQVDYLFSGREKTKYYDMQEFGDMRAEKGLTFVSSHGSVNHIKTLMHNNLLQLRKDIQNLDLSQYDLVLNDFEPISAWASHFANVPSISVSHQAAFLHEKVPVQNQGLIDKKLVKHFAPTRYNLGTHWHHFGNSILPPFVSSALVDKAQESLNDKQDCILVYLPFEDVRQIQEQLQTISDWQFICFHPDITQNGQNENIQWRQLSNDDFKSELVKCAGVIANCGYELSTECISIGKPLLVKPLSKQFEQISNAYTLKTLGLCEVINALDCDLIDEWLQSKTEVQIDYPTDCRPLVDWLLKGDWQDTSIICDELWQNVAMPNAVKARLDRLMSGNI